MPSPTPASPLTGSSKPDLAQRRSAAGRRNSAALRWSRPSSPSGSGSRKSATRHLLGEGAAEDALLVRGVPVVVLGRDVDHVIGAHIQTGRHGQGGGPTLRKGADGDHLVRVRVEQPDLVVAVAQREPV